MIRYVLVVNFLWAKASLMEFTTFACARTEARLSARLGYGVRLWAVGEVEATQVEF